MRIENTTLLNSDDLMVIVKTALRLRVKVNNNSIYPIQLLDVFNLVRVMGTLDPQYVVPWGNPENDGFCSADISRGPTPEVALNVAIPEDRHWLSPLHKLALIKNDTNYLDEESTRDFLASVMSAITGETSLVKDALSAIDMPHLRKSNYFGSLYETTKDYWDLKLRIDLGQKEKTQEAPCPLGQS